MNLRSIKITVCNRRRNRDAHWLHAIKTYQFNWTDALCANNLTKHRNKFFNIIHACSRTTADVSVAAMADMNSVDASSILTLYIHIQIHNAHTFAIHQKQSCTAHCATSCFRIDLLSFSTRSIVNEFSNGFTSSPVRFKDSLIMPDYCGVLNFNGMNFFSSEQWNRIRAFASHTMIYFAVKWTFYTQTRGVLMGFWWLLWQALWIFITFLLCLVNFEANPSKSNIFVVVFGLFCLFWTQVWMILYNFELFEQ